MEAKTLPSISAVGLPLLNSFLQRYRTSNIASFQVRRPVSLSLDTTHQDVGIFDLQYAKETTNAPSDDVPEHRLNPSSIFIKIRRSEPHNESHVFTAVKSTNKIRLPFCFLHKTVAQQNGLILGTILVLEDLSIDSGRSLAAAHCLQPRIAHENPAQQKNMEAIQQLLREGFGDADGQQSPSFSSSDANDGELESSSLENAYAAVDALASVHSSFWNNSDLLSSWSSSWLPSSSSSSSSKAFLKSISIFQSQFLSAESHHQELAILCSRLMSTPLLFDSVSEMMQSCHVSQTLIHGNAIADHFVLTPYNGRALLVSWNNCRFGCGAEDLASFIVSFSAVELWQSLLTRYHMRLICNGIEEISGEDVMHAFRCSLIVHVFPLLVSLAESMEAVKQRIEEESATHQWKYFAYLDEIGRLGELLRVTSALELLDEAESKLWKGHSAASSSSSSAPASSFSSDLASEALARAAAMEAEIAAIKAKRDANIAAGSAFGLSSEPISFDDYHDEEDELEEAGHS